MSKMNAYAEIPDLGKDPALGGRPRERGDGQARTGVPHHDRDRQLDEKKNGADDPQLASRRAHGNGPFDPSAAAGNADRYQRADDRLRDASVEHGNQPA